MECKCKYFKMVRGQLVCVQCGKRPDENVKIEDKTAPVEIKIGGMPEVKTEKSPVSKKAKSRKGGA